MSTNWHDDAAEKAILRAVQEHGANTSILALSRVLRALGPEWAAAATDIEAVTGHSPYEPDDWTGRARTTGPEAPRPLWPRVRDINDYIGRK